MKFYECVSILYKNQRLFFWVDYLYAELFKVQYLCSIGHSLYMESMYKKRKNFF